MRIVRPIARRRVVWGVAALLATAASLEAARSEPPMDALPRPRLTQEEVASGRIPERELRLLGLRIFATPFTHEDGYGDGGFVSGESPLLGGRPTLQGNGTFLRVNGLDGQSCVDCHSVVSAATVPPTFGVGGVGSPVANAMFGTQHIGAMDGGTQGAVSFDGRFINPPFVFGAGAVELLGLEMTEDLQRLAQEARANPGEVVPLVSKGVSFGTIRFVKSDDADPGTFDTSNVVGVDQDLVVKPFGRKGEFETTRQFDLGALAFHFGMQPVESFPPDDHDPDQDGVPDEVLPGEVSALGVFVSTLEAPRQDPRGEAAQRGYETFLQIGCADCHRPALETRGRRLPLRFPEVRTDPWRNVYHEIDLGKHLKNLDRARGGGLVVPLYADLKRHDMGPGLAESFGSATPEQNAEFTTARLWGVADTAPYLHDGRAMTMEEAIRLHGGEARASRDAFVVLTPGEQEDLLRFLRTLRTPRNPAKDLVEKMQAESKRAWKEQTNDEVGGKKKGSGGE